MECAWMKHRVHIADLRQLLFQGFRCGSICCICYLIFKLFNGLQHDVAANAVCYDHHRWHVRAQHVVSQQLHFVPDLTVKAPHLHCSSSSSHKMSSDYSVPGHAELVGRRSHETCTAAEQEEA
eukprot:GHUV01041787.1.p3 GENE.GHUV01041787.1~~GHUV01041787.1.p3  ORF type:complete len:123 (+),score=47.47 GHUV01041787.1:485-853(+)